MPNDKLDQSAENLNNSASEEKTISKTTAVLILSGIMFVSGLVGYSIGRIR